jgi:hypothetical protein
MSVYLQQYERCMRYFKRIQIKDASQDQLYDDFWSFFTHCYHFKDWLINDPEVVMDNKRQTIEQYITNSAPLSICANLANRSKHYTLTRPPRGQDAQITGGNVTVHVGSYIEYEPLLLP